MLKAQYNKMPLDSFHYWHENYYYSNSSQGLSSCEYLYKYLKDTVISNLTYKKVGIKNNDCKSGLNQTYAPSLAFLREDTVLKKVLILNNNYQEKILYNFNKNIGDTAKLYNLGNPTYNLTYTITAKDSSILHDGIYHLRYVLSDGLGGWFEVREGVGGAYGFLTPYAVGLGFGIHLMCTGTSSATSGLIYGSVGCSDIIAGIVNKNMIEENSIKFFPNPTSSILTISSNQLGLEKTTLEFVNNLGQMVLVIPFSKQIDVSYLETGFYFVNIKPIAS
jgi:hypothetical protein